MNGNALIVLVIVLIIGSIPATKAATTSLPTPESFNPFGTGSNSTMQLVDIFEHSPDALAKLQTTCNVSNIRSLFCEQLTPCSHKCATNLLRITNETTGKFEGRQIISNLRNSYGNDVVDVGVVESVYFMLVTCKVMVNETDHCTFVEKYLNCLMTFNGQTGFLLAENLCYVELNLPQDKIREQNLNIVSYWIDLHRSVVQEKTKHTSSKKGAKKH